MDALPMRSNTSMFHTLTVAVTLFVMTFDHTCFASLSVGDEAEYLMKFPQMVAASYSTPMPNNSCVDRGNINLAGVCTLSGTTVSSAQAQSACTGNCVCTVPASHFL